MDPVGVLPRDPDGPLAVDRDAGPGDDAGRAACRRPRRSTTIRTSRSRRRRPSPWERDRRRVPGRGEGGAAGDAGGDDLGGPPVALPVRRDQVARTRVGDHDDRRVADDRDSRRGRASLAAGRQRGDGRDRQRSSTRSATRTSAARRRRRTRRSARPRRRPRSTARPRRGLLHRSDLEVGAEAVPDAGVDGPRRVDVGPANATSVPFARAGVSWRATARRPDRTGP